MEQKQYLNLLDAVFLAVKRSRQPKDSLDVLKGLISLSIASKTLKSCLTDEIIIHMCFKFLRARTLFATNKLKYFIRNNDFGNFEILADLIVFHLPRNEALFTINSLLPYVTQHASLQFLKDYVDYFYTRQLHTTTLANYFTHGNVNDRFKGFHPKILIKAFKLANDNEWIEKTDFLFHLTSIVAGLNNTDKVQDMIAKVKSAIANKTKLNFEWLMHHLMNLYKRRLVDGRGALFVFESLTHVLPKNAVKTTKELFALPIEQQPWFHGNLSRADIRNMFEDPASQNCFVVTFYGASLISDQFQLKKERVYEDSTKKFLPNYGLKSKNGPIDLHLYEFYRSLVANDFEKMKTIAANNVLDWELTMRQPHPITEYLNKIDHVREDVFDWLLEKFGPSNIKLYWERPSIPKGLLRFIRRLIPLKPRMSGNLITQIIECDVPSSKLQMEQLADCWDDSSSSMIWNFVFDHYQKLCKEQRIISEQKIMTLLAWRHAEGDSIGFRNLPKEIVKTIVEFMNEPPLVCTFANILAKKSPSRVINYKMTKEWFDNNDWSVKFYYDHVDKICWDAQYYARTNLATQTMKFYRKHLNDFPDTMIGKIMKTIFKYGTPSLEKGPRVMMNRPDILAIEAFKTRNRPALEYLIGLGRFAMPSREYFAANIKPKHNITYEEALELVDTIKRSRETAAKSTD